MKIVDLQIGQYDSGDEDGISFEVVVESRTRGTYTRKTKYLADADALIAFVTTTYKKDR